VLNWEKQLWFAESAHTAELQLRRVPGCKHS
jgi:hypothetical protein